MYNGCPSIMCADPREMIFNCCTNCSIKNGCLVYNYKGHVIANGILTKIDTPNMPPPTQKIHKQVVEASKAVLEEKQWQ